MKTNIQQLSFRTIVSISLQMWKGKSILRAMMNEAFKKITLTGNILDLGSGKEKPTYYQFLQMKRPYTLTLTDYFHQSSSIIKVNFEKPFEIHKTFDNVVCCNVIEHLYHPEIFLKSTHRHLVNKGQLVGFVPFFIKIHPDPHDYHRYTAESLKKHLTEAGFKDVKITLIGAGPWIAAASQIIDFIWKPLRPFVVMPLFLIDGIINKYSSYHHGAYPLGYMFITKK